MVEVIRAFKILICPYRTFIDLINGIGKKAVFRHMLVVFQYGQCMLVDMDMNLTFRFNDNFFKRI